MHSGFRGKAERRGHFAPLSAAIISAALQATPAMAQTATAQAATIAQEEPTLLDTIRVSFRQLWISLGGNSAADTGTTVYGSQAIANRVEGIGGDANSALRNSPNVQHQNEASNDAGSDSQDLINLKPKLLSISGGKVTENNFRLNGIGINTVTGSEEPFSNTSDLDGYQQTPNINTIYGLHPQTVFVPAEFVEEAKLIDSNASARYGGFLGGVVDYTLKRPSTDKAGGSISSGFTADELTKYNLGTEDGTNSQDMPKPTYGKYTTATEYNLPINDSWALLGQYSRDGAGSSKFKDDRYGDERANDRSRNEMYRLASSVDTDYGLFTLDGALTNYHQTWDGFYYDDTVIDQHTKGLTSQLRWETDLTALTMESIGLKNVKLDSQLYFNDSSTANDSGSNVTTYTAIAARTATSVTDKSKWWFSTDPAVLDWCHVPTLTSWGTAEYCRQGGLGEKEQGQKETGFKSEAKGDLLNGTFLTGLEYRYTDAYRRADEYTFNSVSKTMVGITKFSRYTCAAGDPTCSAQQFNSTKTVTPAYSNRAHLNSFNTYAELDQSWGWLEVRAGARLDYEDYFHNLDISPRLAATITPVEQFSFGAGYNRYYGADTLSYAVRDGQPIAKAYTRTANANTGVVGDWTSSTAQRYYAFGGADVNTPYKDEYTAGVKAADPLFDGEWRLRYVDRRGHDELMAASGSSSVDVTLSNDGESRYRGATLEYAKDWDIIGPMENVALTTSLTWSKQSRSTVSPYMDEDDTRIWYNGGSYTQAEFDRVRGNLDIPLRTAVDLTTTWLDGRLTAGLTGNLNLGFNGVRGTDATCAPSTSATATCRLPAGSDGLGIQHDIVEDFRFKPVVTIDLMTRYRVAETKDTAFDLEFRAENLFNETGNKIAQEDNPWIVGRTFWLGARATF